MDVPTLLGTCVARMTSKELGFPVVAQPGVGHMPEPGEHEKEAVRVFYVAATRATQRLMIGWLEWGIWQQVTASRQS